MTKRTYSSRHKPPTSDAGRIGDSYDGLEVMHDASEGSESEDQLSASVAAGSSVAPNNSKRARTSSWSNKAQHGPMPTAMSPPTNVGGEAKDSEHDAKDPEIQ